MMKNKFLKMTFMALCVSTSSIVNAMNPDDQESYNGVKQTASCAGKYLIMQNDIDTPESGSISIRQESRDRLVLEDFTLTGGYYLERMQEIVSESEERNPNFTSPFNTENRRIANFVLSGIPKELQLNVLKDSDTESQYGGKAMYEEKEVYVRFMRNKDSYSDEERFEIFVESPYFVCSAAPLERFMLIKEGSSRHEFMKCWSSLSSK